METQDTVPYSQKQVIWLFLDLYLTLVRLQVLKAADMKMDEFPSQRR
jgi:hypothetical protein